MTVYNKKLVIDFINVIAEVCAEANLSCCVKESLKGGVLTGLTALVGGILLGPAGLAIGGAIGGGAAAISSARKFKPLPKVIMELPVEHKMKLWRKCQRLTQNFSVENAVALALLISKTPQLKELIIKEVVNFLKSELNYHFL